MRKLYLVQSGSASEEENDKKNINENIKMEIIGKNDKIEKNDKVEKNDKIEKNDKVEKNDKKEKIDKPEKIEKNEKVVNEKSRWRLWGLFNRDKKFFIYFLIFDKFFNE